MNMGKRLYRSRKDRRICGICGGLAEYLGLDSTIIRVVFVLLALIWGGGLLLYLLLMFVVPEAPMDIGAEPKGNG